jgi:hypothetical protein
MRAASSAARGQERGGAVVVRPCLSEINDAKDHRQHSRRQTGGRRAPVTCVGAPDLVGGSDAAQQQGGLIATPLLLQVSPLLLLIPAPLARSLRHIPVGVATPCCRRRRRSSSRRPRGSCQAATGCSLSQPAAAVAAVCPAAPTGPTASTSRCLPYLAAGLQCRQGQGSKAPTQLSAALPSVHQRAQRTALPHLVLWPSRSTMPHKPSTPYQPT